MPNHHLNYLTDGNWSDFAVFCLGQERKQTGVWENVSFIPGFPIWVYQHRLPTIGPIFSIPDNQPLKPTVRTFRILDDLARLNRIWDNTPNPIV